MSKVSMITVKVLKAAPVLTLVVLGACSSSDWEGGRDDYYIPTSYTERYPIEVVKGTVKVNVPTTSSRMSAAQKDAITRFGQQAKNAGANSVSIMRPGGSMKADSIAGQVTQVLMEQGLSASQLRHGTYASSRGGPVSLAFVRKFAKTKKCGNWTDKFTRTGQNLPHADFGCSYQHNLAAQVANPKDFVSPRTMDPSDPMRRERVFDDYRKPKSPTTPADSNSTVSTTSAGKS